MPILFSRSRAAALAGCVGLWSWAAPAHADKPADDFLNPHEPGSSLGIMGIIGPGFRIAYDHRFELEEEISELRTQVMADVIFPYAEGSAHVDLRLFLLTFGASVGYHDEWRVLQFEPDYRTPTPTTPGAGFNFGRDTAGQRARVDPTGSPVTSEGDWLGPIGFTDLTREARRVKEQHADVGEAQWTWVEGRAGFVAPAQGFMVVSTAAVRVEDRPDVSYDWANATVLNSGAHLRWETFFLLRDREIGFVGPAARFMVVPRSRLADDLSATMPTSDGGTVTVRTAYAGGACQHVAGIPCHEGAEAELHYGFVGGIRTNWVTSEDVLLARLYTTYGFDNDLFGTHVFGAPMQLIFAYQLNVPLGGTR